MKPFEDGLALNNKLDKVEVWHKGELFGPESIKLYNGDLYTSIHGGDIVKLTGNHITPVVKFGKPCKGIHEESKCGRPLGMDFDADGNMYACDAYYGVFKVNVQTGKFKYFRKEFVCFVTFCLFVKLIMFVLFSSGKYQQLVSMDQEIGGEKPKIPNAIVVASNGDLYWSDSSTEFSIEDGSFDMLADGTGR